MNTEKKESEEEIRKKTEESCVLILSCFYCGTKLHADKADHRSNTNLLAFKDRNENNDDTSCPKCQKKLPACSVCLFPIEISGQVKSSKIGLVHSLSDLQKEETKKGNNQRYFFCTKCRHGGHVDHYEEWFTEFTVCPFSECKCKCYEIKQEHEIHLG